MRSLVVDASAGLKLVLPELGREEVRRLLRKRRRMRAPAIVPGVFWLEIVNALARRHGYTAAEILEAVFELEQVGITTAEVGRPGLLAVIDLVERFGLTAYDAAYLALAQASDAQLLTADRTLAAAAGERAIHVGDGRTILERGPVYGARETPTWAAWPGAASYLTQLRKGLMAEEAQPVSDKR